MKLRTATAISLSLFASGSLHAQAQATAESRTAPISSLQDSLAQAADVAISQP